MSNPAAIASRKPQDEEYKAIQSEEEARLLPKKKSIELNVLGLDAVSPRKKKKKRKKRKKFNFWKMITNWNFLFFVINTFTPIAIFLWWWMIYPDDTIPYITSGIVGVLIAIVGFRHFRQLMQITREANKFSSNNKKMRSEHRKIKKEINSIFSANKELRDTEHRLREANKKNTQNLSNFREVQNFMQQMDVEDFKEVTNKAAQIGKKWHDELLQQERDMLHLIFDRVCILHIHKVIQCQIINCIQFTSVSIMDLK